MIINITKNKKNLSEISLLNEDLLNGGEILIGRETDCHICLNSFQISRYHAMLKFTDQSVTLSLLSEFGMLKLNGNEIKSSTLGENDKIEIGEYTISVKDLPLVSTKETQLLQTVLDGNEFEDDSAIDSVVENEFSLEDPVDTEDEVGLDVNDITDSLEAEDEAELEEQATDEEYPNEFDMSDNEENPSFNDERENEFSAEEGGFSNEGDFPDTDDSFGNVDDAFGDDVAMSGGDIGEEQTQVFSSFANYSLRIFGEFAPFDKYSLEDGDTLIGRDSEKCQIVLDDEEVSKIHALIHKTKVSCMLEDKDSANGIIHNGDRINKVELLDGDEFIIGDTTFTVEVRSDIIEAESGALMPVEENPEVEIEEIVQEEVDFDTFEEGAGFGEAAVEDKSLFKRIMKDPKKKRIAIGAVVLLAILLFFDGESEPEPINKETKSAKTKEIKKKKELGTKEKFSPETIERLEQNYALAFAKFNEGEYYIAKEYIDKVIGVDPNYSDSQTLVKLIQEGLDQVVKDKAREAEEKERKARQIKILDLVEKAKEAVSKKEVIAAKSLFNQIFELDPENMDVPQLKLEIEAYEQAKAKKEEEEQLKKAKRQSKVDKLAPGKSLFLKNDWYKAIDRLEKFLTIKGMDEDLIKEGTQMLKEAQRNLLLITGPLLSKARSYKEGQDLKQAYETFGEVLKYDPANEEALNERDRIFYDLENRSKKIYREALVAESLSLFSKAKEKFQEVQQISPINSEYFIKASDKLKNYLE